jgi:O-succinylbenzoic acid--CoA ligase
MAYPTVVMDFTVKREVRTIDTSWSTPQFLEAMLRALKGDGPALSTTDLGVNEVDAKAALIVTTSGSTGDPKSVALSANSLISNAKATHKYLGANIGERWSLLLPTSHIAGLNILIRSIELGTEPGGVNSRADYTAIVPTQLHRALTGDTQLWEHLKACKAVLVGGGALDSELQKDATNSGINVVTTYGMTETSGGVVYNGTPLDGVSIDIRDGLIAIKGPQVALGYLNSEFPIHDGWFITKDRGEINNGNLTVFGRIDDQIISGGEKISLSAIESYLQTEFAHPEIVAFATPDKEWGERLCIATTQTFSLHELQERLKKKFGAHASPKVMFKVTSIPYLALGKPDRKKLADDHA